MLSAPLGKFAQVVVAGGVEFKEFSHFISFVGVEVNAARLRIVEVAEWCLQRPDAVADFLPHAPRYVLTQIVHVVLALAKRDLEHE